MNIAEEHSISLHYRKKWDSTPEIDLRKKQSFHLDIAAQRAFNKIQGEDAKVGFLLQIIYFSHMGRFFSTNDFPEKHIRAARKSIGSDSQTPLEYPSKLASQHKKKILKLYNWRAFDKEFELETIEKANNLVDKRTRKSDVTYALVVFCRDNCREIPSYSKINDIVQEQYYKYESTQTKIVSKHLTEAHKLTLFDLVQNSEEFLLHRDIKRINQGTQPSDCRKNGEILAQFKSYYLNFKGAIESIALSQEATEDYTVWVRNQTAPQLKKQKADRRNVAIMAYFEYQLFNRTDAAALAIDKTIAKLRNDANTYKNKQSERREKDLLDATAAISNVTKNTQALVQEIINIGSNPYLTDKQKVNQILRLAEAFMLSDLEDVDSVLQTVDADIETRKKKLDFYYYIFEKSRALQNRISPLLQHIHLDESSDRFVMAAVNAFQSGLKSITDETPTGFLSKLEKELLFRDDEFNKLEKYKSLLFIKFAESLKDQTITLNYSYKHRPVESYFMPREIWQSRTDSILNSTGLWAYRNVDECLEVIGQSVTQNFHDINERISTGENKHVKFHKNGNWWLDTETTDFSTDQFVSQLLGEETSVSLYQIVHQINSYTNFTDEMEHQTKRYASNKFKLSHAYAALISLGTNIGHQQMSKASDISVKQMRDIEATRFSNLNLKKMNEKVIELIQSLSLPTIYTDEDGKLITSSDGRKLVVHVDSLLANFSYKYYGKEKGISVNSFVDDKQSFFHVNILTSSDREAPFMLEGMVESKRTLFPESKIKKENHLHATDTHGYTEAIFAGMHFLGVTFAPRIKNVQRQTLYAYNNKSLKKNSDYKIGPNTKINRKIIIEHWDDILRMMASIKMNYISAADIFKKLSASKKDVKLYKAVKEFGRLLKTHFLLNYIDDLDLRQKIEKQLNRVELGQKLSRTVFHGRGKRLYVGAKEDIERVVLCSTIIQNCIIAWNYLFLSDHLIAIANQEQRHLVAESISEGSVISWEHINIMGWFDFEQLPNPSFHASLREMRNIKL